MIFFKNKSSKKKSFEAPLRNLLIQSPKRRSRYLKTKEKKINIFFQKEIIKVSEQNLPFLKFRTVKHEKILQKKGSVKRFLKGN
jgi:hypothetical protein